MSNQILSHETAMSPTQIDFANRFAHYEIVVKVADSKECGPEPTDDGRSFFTAGAMKISTRREKIIVIVASGAYIENLTMLKDAAEAFRDGKAWSRIFDRLEAVKYQDSDDEWYRTNWLGWTADEWSEDFGYRVVACNDDRCSETWHEYDDVTELGSPDVTHLGDVITHPAGRYTVTMNRMTASDWRIDVELHGHELNVFEARSLANDICWLSTECEKLNATAAVAV